MGLLDLFSGSPGRKAAIAQAQQVQAAMDRATGSISGAQNEARGLYDEGRTTLGQLPALYQPWTGAGTQAVGALSDAYGLNGAEGNSRATAAFRAAPGYNWMRDQAIDAAVRKAGSIGTATGNTFDAVTRLGGNLADQQWDKYLAGLGGLSTQGLTATGQVGQGLTNTANLYGDEAKTLGNLALGGAGITANLGSQLGSIAGGGMMAGQQANANTLSAILGGAQLLAGLGGSGGGSFLKPLTSGISSLFGGAGGNNGITGGFASDASGPLMLSF